MNGPSFYAFVGNKTSELLSYRGRILLHTDPHEMEFLIPGYRVVKVGAEDLAERCMLLRDHPDLATVSWPLRKEAFR